MIYNVYIVACYATEDAVQIGKWVLLQFHTSWLQSLITLLLIYTTTRQSFHSVSRSFHVFSLTLHLHIFTLRNLPAICWLSPHSLGNRTVQSQSQSHIATDGQSVSKSWCRAESGAHDQIFITVSQLRSCFCGAASLTRGWVCLWYMVLALARAVFLGSESGSVQAQYRKLCPISSSIR
jgi:hypothetical protein